MIFNIAIDIFVKAQKSRDSEMPLPAPRGTESGFKLSSLSSQWPKARRARARGGGRGQGAVRGRLCLVMLSVSVCLLALKALRWARVCVCVCICALGQGHERVGGGGGTIAVWVASTSAAIDSLVDLLHCSSIAVSVTCIKFNWIAREGECGQRCCKRNVFGAWIGLLCYICNYAIYVGKLRRGVCVCSSIDDIYLINWGVVATIVLAALGSS